MAELGGGRGEAGAPKIDVSREEGAAVNSQIRRAGPGAYVRLVRATRHSAAPSSLHAVPGTQNLLRLSRALSWCKPLIILLSPLALLITPWWWALAGVVVLFLLLNSAQTEVNLELGARLLAADRKMKREWR